MHREKKKKTFERLEPIHLKFPKLLCCIFVQMLHASCPSKPAASNPVAFRHVKYSEIPLPPHLLHHHRHLRAAPRELTGPLTRGAPCCEAPRTPRGVSGAHLPHLAPHAHSSGRQKSITKCQGEASPLGANLQRAVSLLSELTRVHVSCVFFKNSSNHDNPRLSIKNQKRAVACVKHETRAESLNIERQLWRGWDRA